MPVPEHLKTPVTIITGFLGAGKTTLVNHILKNKGNRRVAVIENEFGEVNIDGSLVAENLVEKEELVTMANGCVCCSLRSDIVDALAELERRAKRRGQRFDNVLLETTGLADPAPVAFTFFANPWIGSKFRLDSILTIVDALHVLEHVGKDGSRARQPNEVDEAVNQIAFADTILLNKTDLVSPEQLEIVRKRVRSININAQLIECQLNDDERHPPDWDTLMNVNSFSIERALEVDPTFMDSESDVEDEEEEDGRSGSLDQPSSRGAPAGLGGQPTEASPAEDGAETAVPHASSVGEKRSLAEAVGTSGRVPLDGPVACARMPKRRRRRHHDLADVRSVGITAHGSLDQHRFNEFMRDLLSEKARDIFRSKGVLCVKGQERTRFVFQGVHETICFGPAAQPWGENDKPLNQIIFIGRNLQREELLEGFRSCIWLPLPDGWSEHLDKRTRKPYFVNAVTGEKTWLRPSKACAMPQVKASVAPMPKQPTTMPVFPAKDFSDA